jgi:hypothetical protein
VRFKTDDTASVIGLECLDTVDLAIDKFASDEVIQEVFAAAVLPCSNAIHTLLSTTIWSLAWTPQPTVSQKS